MPRKEFLSASQKRSYVIPVRLSESELQTVKVRAEGLKESPGTFLRAQALGLKGKARRQRATA